MKIPRLVEPQLRETMSRVGDRLEGAAIWRLTVALATATFLAAVWPYVWQGQNAIVEVHDNLDSDVVWFHAAAESRYTFSFDNQVVIEPFLGGELPRNALPPALNVVTTLFVLFEPFTAYLANYLIVRLVGISAMYALLVGYVFTNSRERVYALVVALGFGLLPHHGLHPGIAVTGLPLVVLVFAALHQGRQRFWHYLLLVCYGFYSSLIYVGFFVLLLVSAVTLLEFSGGRIRLPSFLRMVAAAALLSLTYLAAEWNLIQLILSDFVGHRQAFDPVASGTSRSLSGALNLALRHLLEGQYHVSSLHAPIVLATTGGAMAFLGLRSLCPKSCMGATGQRYGYWLATSLLLLATISLLYGLWYWTPVAEARSGLQVQFNRFHWLTPFLWSLAFALALVILRRTASARPLFVLGLAALHLLFVLGQNHYLRYNYAQMAGRAVSIPTFQEFYSPSLFDAIKERVGPPSDSTRVVSVGLFPDIAIYNGLYTLDSYQRLYPLSYKERFRRVIKPELDKSEELRRYFDYWGNRCYVFSAELGMDHYIPKAEVQPIRLDLDVAALDAMGGRYLLSAVPIVNAAEQWLVHLETYEHVDSPYRVELYELMLPK